MKFLKLLTLILSITLCLSVPTYASWTEYTNVRYLDLDGDLAKEIIIESKHGAGTGHYIEDIRIFKDTYPELELIFTIRTLDSYFDSIYGSGKYWDIVSEVEFTEPTVESKGIRDIIVRSKKIYYKDGENKIVNKVEDLGKKVYRWNGEEFVE